jgi:hypothetical protein
LMPPLLADDTLFSLACAIRFRHFDASHYFTLLIFAISPLHCWLIFDIICH